MPFDPAARPASRPARADSDTHPSPHAVGGPCARGGGGAESERHALLRERRRPCFPALAAAAPRRAALTHPQPPPLCDAQRVHVPLAQRWAHWMRGPATGGGDASATAFTTALANAAWAKAGLCCMGESRRGQSCRSEGAGRRVSETRVWSFQLALPCSSPYRYNAIVAEAAPG